MSRTSLIFLLCHSLMILVEIRIFKLLKVLYQVDKIFVYNRFKWVILYYAHQDIGNFFELKHHFLEDISFRGPSLSK